jgi:hypothetical protein
VQLGGFVSSLRPDRKAAGLLQTGIYVPLYVYPGAGGMESYDRIIQAKLVHPRLSVLVAINPSSGPGAGKDDNYVQAIGRLRSAGISVIGYVYTKWGKRGLASVAADIRRYRTWYGLEGVLVDEFSTDPAKASYYLAVRRYSQSLGMTFVMGNPGTDVPAQFVGMLADNFTIYENAGLPDSERLGGWHAEHDRANWSCCAHSAHFNEKHLMDVSRHLGFLYATDDTPPNPYDRLSSYFERLVQVFDPL